MAGAPGTAAAGPPVPPVVPPSAGVVPAVPAATPPAVPPDAGSVPVLGRELPAALLPHPSEAPSAPAVTAGTATPILQRIAREEAAVESLAERVNDATGVLAQRRSAQYTATAALTSATSTLTLAERDADRFVRTIYRASSALPDDVLSAPPIAGLALVVPGDHPIYRLAVAQNSFDDSAALAAKANQEVQRADRTLAGLRRQLTTRGGALRELKATHAAALAAAQRARDAQNLILGQAVGDNSGRQGTAATRAVAYALAQLGKPYVWGDEGPDTFDCSGLVQTAYATAGVRLPRTARPQYRATQTVPVNALLPGDLLFFATDKSNWDSIHHVGIYLGRGRMVHAPTTGDVVKIAPVWWAEFYAATRVVPGVNGPAVPIQIPVESPRPAPRPRPVPRPKPTPVPSAPAPRPTPSGSPSPSPSASGTPTSGPPTPPSCPTPAPAAPPSPAPGTPPCASPTPAGSTSPSAPAGSPSTQSTPSPAASSTVPPRSPSTTG